MEATPLDERKQQILKAVVSDYTVTGVPVGSQVLASVAPGLLQQRIVIRIAVDDLDVLIDRAGVVVQTRERRDEARRFNTLIDTLYEAHANLVASAEVAPEQLYPVGDGDFEFQRTVSRLMEMQSEEYIANRRV